MNKHTDLELIQQTLNGESDAFGELIRRYQDAVYATALHRIKDFAIAQDVAQEAFIEAYGCLHKLREPDRFPGWLHTITLRQCNRWQRKRRESTSIDELDEPQPGAVRPDEELERRELRRIVLDAIASLPENAGEVVTMYYMDGLSYSEIAGFLSVPTSTVKGRLQMGRKQLKEELITMVEDSLKQNRPDKKFTEKVLAEIVEQVSAARERDSHDEIMQFCAEALETLDHLDATEDHKRTRMDILNWQGREWLGWFGEAEKATESFRYAAQIAADIGDLNAQASWLVFQVVAISNTGNYQAMREPLQDARDIYDKLGDVHGQTACDATMELIDLLPDGWELTWVSQEDHTSYGSKRYSLMRSADSLAYIEDPPAKQRSMADLRLSLVRRGFYVLGNDTLLGRVAEPTLILNLPPVVGDSWSRQIKIRGEETLSLTRSIESDSDTVVVPAGRFENCLRVVTDGQEPANADFSDYMKTFDRQNMCGTRIMWFAPGVGLVKYRHRNDRGGWLNIQLIEYQIEDADKDDYFPLSVGNRWKYERYEGDLFNVLVTESYRVAAREGDEAHIACGMYTKLLNPAQQRDYYQSCLEYGKDSDGDPDAKIWALMGLATAYARLGDTKAAMEACQQADELAATSGDVKQQFDVALGGAEWSYPPDFVMERYEQALEIAEKMGNLERQDRCLGNMFDFAIRYQRGKWYSKALDTALRVRRIASELGASAEMASMEASIDLARSLIANPEGKNALNGGSHFRIAVEVSDEWLRISADGGIGHTYDRPYPPNCNVTFWQYAPFLKLPVQVGTRWSHSDGGASTMERVIEADNETVSVSAGEFDGVVRVKSIFQTRTANEGGPQANEVYNRKKEFRDGEKWMWFAPGAGIIKLEHHHANGKRTVIELTDYDLTEPSDDYLPLAIGNKWNYEWRDENGDLLFKVQERVVLKHDGKFYLASSGYTTNVAEYGEHQYG